MKKKPYDESIAREFQGGKARGKETLRKEFIKGSGNTTPGGGRKKRRKIQRLKSLCINDPVSEREKQKDLSKGKKRGKKGGKGPQSERVGADLSNNA